MFHVFLFFYLCGWLCTSALDLVWHRKKITLRLLVIEITDNLRILYGYNLHKVKAVPHLPIKSMDLGIKQYHVLCVLCSNSSWETTKDFLVGGACIPTWLFNIYLGTIPSSCFTRIYIMELCLPVPECRSQSE